MSLNHQDSEIGQSPGCDPKTSKRNSGLFAFLKWFKPSTSRESIDTQNSSSCESLNSIQSSGTVASFSYVPPNDYTNKVSEKCIVPGPETDTYRARLKQRDKRRENDKNTTLRKKYNLFFNRETLLKPATKDEEDENSKSLPLMTRPSMEEEEKAHRRTNSESSKTKKAGAYLHVKGKRRAPQPPTTPNTSTMSLRRKKRLAPPPPSLEKIKNTPESEIIFNDSLKLDHGILKPAKETASETKSSVCETPVSPRPWYKRTSSTKAEEKRKSGMSFLTNISELDREASEIVRKEHQKNGNDLQEIPQFMRPKEEAKINTDSWASPKRRSAKDLIAKFNAITSVTKATVFGVAQNQKKDYFGRRTSLLTDERKQESLLENHKKRIEQIDRKVNPLMKSESASAIKPKPETPKVDRKNWNCPKCSIENDYWRIICHVCSTIKPYFDDFSATKPEEKPPEKTPEKAFERAKTQIGFSALASYNLKKKIEKSVSLDEEKVDKNEEREKLKKMLIEMKNSLPKRKSNILMKQNSRQSVIEENPEQDEKTEDNKSQDEKVVEIVIGTSETIYENIKVRKSETPKPVKISVSAQTNAVKLEKKSDLETPKSILREAEPKVKEMPKEQEKKSEVSKQATPPQPDRKNNLELPKPAPKMEQEKKTNFELMRPKDFENIYSDPNGQSPARIYANLARNDELSLFFNMPKRLTELKNNLQGDKNTDTIEINRLLKRLETSIAKGELTEAAIYAKELAQLKVNCSVVRQKPVNPNGKKQGFSIEMFVEDKISHRGPFPLEVTENQTVAELKSQVEKEFEIPVNVQRWILGKELATDDNSTLKDHKITTERCPVFLYLVAPDAKTGAESKIGKSEEVPSTSKEKVAVNRIPKIVDVIPKIVQEKKSLVEPTTSQTGNEDPKLAQPEDDLEDYDSKTLKPGEWECHLCTLLNPISSNICAVCATVRQKDLSPVKRSSKKKLPQPQTDQTYLQLVNLDNKDLVENRDPFECLVCFMEIAPGDGVTLRECLHQFCKFCLAHTVEYTEDAEVKCPYRDEQYSCNIALQDREIKALVTPKIYEHYLAKSVAEAENKIGKSFHCKTPDCKGWCIFEDNVNEFRCPVCRKINCLTCQAIHSGLNCKQYQEKMTEESEVDEDARRTKEMVNEMVKNGEALTCPTCQVILMKKWGCDWVRCSMCKTEICWVTRGPRWGPGGKGDTSGGCQCGVNGVKCHPKCSYCH